MRAVHRVTRVLAVLLGLVLLALGVCAVTWWSGRWDLLTAREFGTLVDLTRVADEIERGSWQWGILGVGLVLILLALCWVIALMRRRRVRTLRLPGSSAGAVLGVRTSPVVHELDRRLGRVPGVVRARSTLLVEGRVPVLDVTAWAEPDHDLTDVGTAVEELLQEAGAVLGRSELHVRVRLAVARRSRSPRSRVH